MNSVFSSLISIGAYMERFHTVGNAADRMPIGYTPTWYEKSWLSIFEGRNEAVAYGVLIFVFHISLYFLSYSVQCIFESIPALRKYKLQQTVHVTNEEWWTGVRRFLANMFFIRFPTIMLFFPLAEALNFDLSVPFPPIYVILLQTFIFMLSDDFWHYWIHRLMHMGFLYQRIHKVHHEYTVPFGLIGDYSHPIESIILALTAITGPVMYSWLATYTGSFKGAHVIAIFSWIAVKTLESLEVHTGYDFPWSLNNWIPIWAGADHHDYHHMEFLNNFASIFRHMDYIFGTDKLYREHHKKRKQLELEKDQKDKKE
ncbi:Methylsterol monooxygenase [Zancudomyces culisetae]|uniref:Methylsterol monooxygenase n=1 Tax=Zancudomyces culisetae TaxID=1213189 RepID=A0A1R1PK62_ZANCU|nr:Methylsterol monooxygenase [Zancudomyces culisetae]OMH81361.1 Methylsterol monooxygenase [Zancudomyces culisetae]|eukprot:OMH79866.1 Methylsterol monooxygenase [Zancudomyces culisetae]